MTAPIRKKLPMPAGQCLCNNNYCATHDDDLGRRNCTACHCFTYSTTDPPMHRWCRNITTGNRQPPTRPTRFPKGNHPAHA